MSESEQTPPESHVDTPRDGEGPTPDESQPGKPGRGLGGTRIRIGAVVAVVAALGFFGWAIAGVGDDSSSSSQSPVPTTAAGTGPVALSSEGLRTLAATFQSPIYWLGTKPETMYELRQLTNGNVYLRYLPSGVQAGDPRPLLTIGTYPMQDAYSITLEGAKKSGAVQIDAGKGGVAFYTDNNPTSTYAAFPGSDYQVEVYSPVRGVARKVVARGGLTTVPAGGASGSGAKAISPRGLRALAKSLGQPVYWAGRRPGSTLELSQTPSGRLYVRYLPRGAAVGAPGPYLTVGTYALTNAFSATSGLGQNAENTSLKLPGGGIAVFGKGATAKNVYLAYPGSDYQVEVFDPTAGTARRLVAAGRIAALR
jgi:hypothetical protein